MEQITMFQETGFKMKKVKPMKILVACEESQAVCIELRKLGHEAYSADIQECSGGHPEWHILGDVIPLINGDCKFTTMDGVEHEITGEFDFLICFPPCTNLASSGARWFPQKQLDGSQEKSVEFFLTFTRAKCKRILIENPVGIMSTRYRKPDQIIQPWQFGHGETKATCIWLIGDLNKLQPTNIVSGRENRVWRMPPSKDRAKLRSKTYPGIAKAIAEQLAGDARYYKEAK